ncbi:MAG: sigma-70 family RNA polymerase sigma factor [Candidatus Eisenbacteria bacterium]
MMPDAELRHLLARVAAGEEAALESLYEATSAWVYGLARRILRDESTAQEVTLDTYLHAWRRAHEYDGRRGRPSTWLLTIARSRAIDRLRSHAARSRREEHAGMESTLEADSPEGPQIDREAVRAAMATLPAAQKRAIEMAFFGGLSHSEIARELDTPLGTVKSQVRLGMLKLRSVLEPPEHWGTA